MQFEALRKVCLFPLHPGPFEMLLLQGHAVYCIGVSVYVCVMRFSVLGFQPCIEIKQPQFCRYQDYGPNRH